MAEFNSVEIEVPGTNSTGPSKDNILNYVPDNYDIDFDNGESDEMKQTDFVKNNGEHNISSEYPNNNTKDDQQCSSDGACGSGSSGTNNGSENIAENVTDDELSKDFIQESEGPVATAEQKTTSRAKKPRIKLENQIKKRASAKNVEKGGPVKAVKRKQKTDRMGNDTLSKEKAAAGKDKKNAKEKVVKEKAEKVNVTVDFKNGSLKKNKNKGLESVIKLSKPTMGEATSRKRVNSSTARGRPPKRKTLVATYHSQISGDKNGIKLCIKKSNFVPEDETQNKNQKRKRQKYPTALSETEGESDYEIPEPPPVPRPKKSRASCKSRHDKTCLDLLSKVEMPPPVIEQTGWGGTMPSVILQKIFKNVCTETSPIPALIRLSKVCRLWRMVANDPFLWQTVDLSTNVKEKMKTDLRLRWIIENRLSACEDLNLSHWKVNNVSLLLEILCRTCQRLKGLNISGWSGVNADHLKYISTKLPQLQRLDMSSINPEGNSTKCMLNAQSLAQFPQDMGSRLTHLLLANNKLSGFIQLMASLSSYCPNLQLLDLSNIRTMSQAASLYIEKLQEGCQQLRVLRITNSQIVLASVPLQEQVDSPGFPSLEELSLAGINDFSRLMDDNSIERILKTSHKLRLLDVRGCARISDSSLVRIPAWDLEHLFLSGCVVTRDMNNSGLELIARKWSHSLIEVDLAWSTAAEPLDAAVMALAEADTSSLKILNLCGSSISLEPVKAVLKHCPHLNSINLSSCRALPRGIKRLYEGSQVNELRASLEPKPKSPTPEPDQKSTAEPEIEGLNATEGQETTEETKDFEADIVNSIMEAAEM